MTSETLNLWGKGSVTLPKAWREQFPTKHFMAISTPEGLLIKPILEMEYYEDKDGLGVRFPMGIEAGELATLVKKANSSLKPKKKPRKRHG